MQLVETDVRSLINEYVCNLLKGYSYSRIARSKVIHDTVHGTHLFHPYEIAFLDLPIVQRLRRISQTDVTSFVFPSGNHNRFEHTVGTAVVAGLMIDSVFQKSGTVLPLDRRDYAYNNCRIAAILHDCGHGPFSHLSEQIFSEQFNNIKINNPVFSGASAHEILSYFVATSDPLKEFNSNIIKGLYGIDIDLDFVGEMIVGYIDRIKRKEFGFAVEIINGAFDSDKLDYILRDAHATGVRMALDLPRLMYTLNVIPEELGKESVLRLAIDISGVAALEEIVFNKMMLTSTIYHHQKVRAAGCLLKGIMEMSGRLNSALDYIKLTDDEIYGLNLSDPVYAHQLHMFKNRNLPKRAFCFSSRTLEDRTALQNIMSKFDDREFKNDVIANIALYIRDNLGKDVQQNEIWIDSPKNPKFKEATQCLIKTDGSENGYLLLRDVFPTDDWVRAFSENKWHGFVYAMPENCNEVAIASKIVLEAIFDTKFNPFATRLCKIPD